MGRTKKRHRAWKQQMRARARKRRDWGFRWDDDRKVDLIGQAITAAAIAVGALVLIYNLVRWLCGN